MRSILLLFLTLCLSVGCVSSEEDTATVESTALVPPGPDEFLVGVQLDPAALVGSGNPPATLGLLWGTPTWGFGRNTTSYVHAVIPTRQDCPLYKVEVDVARWCSFQSMTAKLTSPDGLTLLSSHQTPSSGCGFAERIILNFPERSTNPALVEVMGHSSEQTLNQVKVWYVCQFDE